MKGLLNAISSFGVWFAGEYVKDYRETNTRLFELQTRTIAHLNQIILTVSVAGLTAIAALNERVFVPYSLLSFLVILFLVITILLAVVNLYLSNITYSDAQTQLAKNLVTFKTFKTGMESLRFIKIQKVLNFTILSLFCLGLVALLLLLSIYIFGGHNK